MNIFLRGLNSSRSGDFKLVPNINNSGRSLNTSVNPDEFKDNIPDFNTKSRKLTLDKELYVLVLELSKEEKEEIKKKKKGQFILEMTFDNLVFNLLNRSGIPIDKKVFDLKDELGDSTKFEIEFILETKTFRRSPLLEENTRMYFSCIVKSEKDLILKRFPEDPKSKVIPADLILVGDDAPAERVFMCELDENQPSVQEVKEAVQKIGVPLTLVPKSVNVGDTWLQDQFQLGYMAGKNAQSGIQVIIHLPRMVNDSALIPTTPNLKNFVEKYFISQSIGLFNDFWEVEVPIMGKTVSVEASFVIFKGFLAVRKIMQHLAFELSKHDKAEKKKFETFKYSDLYAVRKEIDAAYKRLQNAPKVRPEFIRSVNKAIGIYNNFLKVNDKGNILLTIMLKPEKDKPFAPQEFEFSDKNKQVLNQFFQEVAAIHSSLGYGGNIEVSPPMSGIQYGKIITGSLANTAIASFLDTQSRSHPKCLVYTKWLEVGHIDEIMGFAQNNNSSCGFSIMRASPVLALALLREIKKYKNVKNTLVTRLFRGKKWSHEAIPDGTTPHLPPKTYLSFVKIEMHNDKCIPGKYDLCGFKKRFNYDVKETFYDSVFHDDRRFMVLNPLNKVNTSYAAFISCEDLLDLTAKTNQAVHDLFLSNGYEYADNLSYESYYNNPDFKEEVLLYRLDTVLKQEFASASVLQVPVLFDAVENFHFSQTSAIIPDMVNFQTINDHVLIPRPFGPRMKTKDAIDFIKQFISSDQHSRNLQSKLDSVNEKFIESAGLNKVYHWANPLEMVSIAKIQQTPTDFDEGFEQYKIDKSLAMYSQSYPTLAADIIWEPIEHPFYTSHKKNPFENHPDKMAEDLRMIASWFKDGFDEFKNYPVDFCKDDTSENHPKLDFFEKNIEIVEDKIRKANPGVFDPNGAISTKGWVKIAIPEGTVDVFELYVQIVFLMTNVKIHWVDSWYYHTHNGGIHCGTNVLRTPVL